MITVDNKEIEVKHFPDGTQCLMNVDITDSNKTSFTIKWNYESDEELVTLMFLVGHIRDKLKNVIINLFIPYVPNARMDRVKHNSEVFTLKYFANIINSLNFNNVYVFDVHSDVSSALINNIVVISPETYINDAISDIIDHIKFYSHETPDVMIYFPDAGAYKRYKDMHCFDSYNKIYGKKVRNWETGKIEGLKLVDENDNNLTEDKPLEGKTVIMIDDIISYGGTMHYSAHTIKGLGAKWIYAYASHVEPNSLRDSERGLFGKDLKYNIVEHLFTTDSIYKHTDDEHAVSVNAIKL